MKNQPTATTPQISDRRIHWQQVIQAEISKLLPKAADTHAKIVGAKTQTKANFYRKKFNAIQNDITKYTNALQLLEPTEVNGIADEHDDSQE
jgi:uncharacterized coiled-coil DUF342 family protein